MAFYYGFYDSVNGDRKYNAQQMSQIFDGIIVDGVLATVGDKFAVSPGDGLSVNVGTGRAWFDHTWSYNDSIMRLDLSAADPVYRRIDAVVLEVNAAITSRINAIKVVEGLASANPSKPNLVNNSNLHQHALAYVTIEGAAESISAENIEYMVGKTECPYSTAPLQSIDASQHFANMEAQFNDWFNSIHEQLSGDIVTNLQRQIDNNKISANTLQNMGLEITQFNDDAFAKIWGILKLVQQNVAEITCTVTASGSETPLEGIEVTGIFDDSGRVVKTDSSGVAKGYIASGDNQRIAIDGYIDLSAVSQTFNVTKGETLTKELKPSVLTSRTYATSAVNQRFSSNVSSVSATLVGGGEAGQVGYKAYDGRYNTNGSGGRGGYVYNVRGLNGVNFTIKEITVGAAYAWNMAPTHSTMVIGGTTYSSSSGVGAYRGGTHLSDGIYKASDGGDGTTGVNGTTYGGGGGHGGFFTGGEESNPGYGGAGGGGRGGYYIASNTIGRSGVGQSGSSLGSGGGGGGEYSTDSNPGIAGGAGHNGGVVITWTV